MVIPTSIIGFDSAWTDSAKAPGAVCIIRLAQDGGKTILPPVLARFDDAIKSVEAERATSPKIFVAIDQPTIVPNATGSRPADRVAASLMSFVGGGVQPANRSKIGMFDDAAPIWRFKSALAASDDIAKSRTASDGTFVAEVFPAMALLSFNTQFCARLAGPRYNPARRKTFQQAHWREVLHTLSQVGIALGLPDLSQILGSFPNETRPSKADQDRLDAIICALIGLVWLSEPREKSLLIGDIASGQILVPALGEAKNRLIAAALQRSVPIE